MREVQHTANEEAHSSVNTIRNESIIAPRRIAGTPEAPQHHKSTLEKSKHSWHTENIYIKKSKITKIY